MIKHNHTRKGVVFARLRSLTSQDGLYLAALVAIAFITHWVWFVPSSVLFHQDWSHVTNQLASQAWQAEGTWKNFLGFGAPNIQIGYYLVTVLWPIIHFLGGSADQAVKLTVLIPVAILGFTAPYTFARNITKNKFISFVVALFYGSTTYFLARQGAHLQIAFVYALSPVIFFFFKRALETMKYRDWLLFSLTYTIGMCYEIRIIFIFTFVLGLYFLFFSPPKNYSRILTMVPWLIIVLACLNSFWLLPTLLGGAQSEIALVTSRNLFSNDLFDLQHAFTISSSSWTGGVPNENFVMQPVKIYLWLIPLIAFTPMILYIKRFSKSNQKLIIFFTIISLTGIFLTKQVDRPLTLAYPWLYANFPGFSLFREASKFYLLTVWGYSGLLVMGLLKMKNLNLKIFRLIVLVPVAIACVNLFPLVTGNFGTMFTDRHIPNDYVLLNDRLSSGQGFERTLWVPSTSQWAYFDVTHPKVSAVSALEREWQFIVKSDGVELTNSKLSDFLTNPLASNLTTQGSVKYFIVPLRDRTNDDDFIRYYGNDRQFYIDALDKLPWLNKLNIGTKQVIVYENKNYKPYFTGLDRVLDFKDLEDARTKYKFSQDIGLGTDFSATNGASHESSVTIEDLFDKEAIGHGLQKNIHRDPNKIYTLYNDSSSSIISYVVQDDFLKIDRKTPPAPKVTDAELPPQTPAHSDKFRVLGKDYFLSFNDVMLKVNPKEKEERNLGLVGGEVNLYTAADDNLVENPDLKDGLWKDKVEDCNNYDDRGLVWMEHSSDNPLGTGGSLKLQSALHTACSGPDSISVSPGEYILSFDYKGENSKQAGYTIEFNDSKKTRINKRFEIGNKQWSSYSTKLTVPEGATSLKLRVNAYDQLVDVETSPKATMYYTNLRLSQLALVKMIKDGGPKYEKVALPGSDDIKASLGGDENLMTNKFENGSLENGLWAQKVGDCNAYDNSAQIGMRESNDASDGNKSLELEAKSHIACTGPKSVNVREGSQYLLNFNYQSPNSQQAGYFISFNDQAGTVISERLHIKDKKWNNFSRTIKVPFGATEMSLVVYSYPDTYSKEMMINRYDNFSLTEIPDVANRFYIVSEPQIKLVKPKNIEFDLLNPNKKTVHIKGATTPFYLSMSEAYNSGWRLEVNNRQVNGLLNSWWPKIKSPDLVNEHLKLDGYLNGWYVDVDKLCGEQKLCKQNDDGSYDIELIAEFTPQRWFYLGSIISSTTFVGSMGYLGVDWWKSRSRKKVAYSAR